MTDTSNPPQYSVINKYIVIVSATCVYHSTRCLMFFACMGDITQNFNTIAGALAAAQLFNRNSTIPGDLLSGLSEQQLLECVNWDFAAVETIPTFSEWGLIAMAGIFWG